MLEDQNPLDLAAIENSLCCPGIQGPDNIAWLESSWENPGSFWHGLVQAHQRQVPGRVKSELFRHYDFFYDLAGRFKDRPLQAMQVLDSKGRAQSLSYAELGRQAALLSRAWAGAGAKNGQLVALVLHPGPELAAALLAALKLGLVFSFVPPQGRWLVQRRLKALDPDHLVMDSLHAAQLRAYASRVLPWTVSSSSSDNYPETISSVYPSGSTAALLFDPSSMEPDMPRAVSSDTLYLGAMRDGLIALGLRPGEFFAASGFDPLTTWPSMLLAGLLNAGTFVHMTLEQIREDPRRILSVPCKVLGISRGLRDILLKEPLSLRKSCEHWFRHPGETVDITPWMDWIEAMDLKKSYASNLAWTPVLGGCCLISPRRMGIAHNHVLPAPGSLWHLRDITDPSTPSMGDWGVLVQSIARNLAGHDETQLETTLPAPAVIAPQGQVWNYIRPPHVDQDGLHFPENMVQEVAASALPRGVLCLLITLPGYAARDDSRRVLVVFTAACIRNDGTMNPGQAQIRDHLRRTISRELGAYYLPHKIEFLPLFPRMIQAGEMDQEWSRDQYLSGKLHKKAKNQLFRQIGRFQAVVG